MSSPSRLLLATFPLLLFSVGPGCHGIDPTELENRGERSDDWEEDGDECFVDYAPDATSSEGCEPGETCVAGLTNRCTDGQKLQALKSCNAGDLVVLQGRPGAEGAFEDEHSVVISDQGVVDWFIEQSELPGVGFRAGEDVQLTSRPFPNIVEIQEREDGNRLMVIRDFRPNERGFQTSEPGTSVFDRDGGVDFDIWAFSVNRVGTRYHIGHWFFETCNDLAVE